MVKGLNFMGWGFPIAGRPMVRARATSRGREARLKSRSGFVRVAIAVAVTFAAGRAAAQTAPTGDQTANGLPQANGAPTSPGAGEPGTTTPRGAPPAAANGVPQQGPNGGPLGGPPGAATSPSEVPAASTATDKLPQAGYVPGYRPDHTLGMSPYAPRVGGLPGGMTPGFGSPMPSNQWTFRWTGFFTASLQTSTNTRQPPTGQTSLPPGESSLVFHTPPQTVDEYGSFLSTATMPGQWVQLNFTYGNRYVSANLSLTTWNPDDPTTFYQLGSQQFVNNFYLSYTPAPIGKLHVHAIAGYFYNLYGSLAQYGLGMYTSPLVGGIRGVGEDLFGEYAVNDDVSLLIEDGISGDRNGMPQISIVPSGANGAQPQVFPATYMHHLHLGIEKRGQTILRAKLHLLQAWSQDDRVQLPFDNQQTRQIDESYVRDGHLTTYGAEVAYQNSFYGYLGAAVSYTHGTNAYPLTGMTTFGGDGQSLTNRWWGQDSGGAGDLFAAGINYTVSIGQLVSYPVAFNPDGPDLTLNAGLIYSQSWTEYPIWDGRGRYKGGVDLLYSFLPFMGIGFRTDVVIPNSFDSQETYTVLAPRIVFKSDWQSRDTVTLIYGKWLYGRDTHLEASSISSSTNNGERLDDQLFAINAQMYW
jgi:hypothetical protein